MAVELGEELVGDADAGADEGEPAVEDRGVGHVVEEQPVVPPAEEYAVASDVRRLHIHP